MMQLILDHGVTLVRVLAILLALGIGATACVIDAPRKPRGNRWGSP